METIHLVVKGMSCGGCVRHVSQALASVPGARVEQVKVGSATVTFDPAKASATALVKAIEEAGYEASEVATA